MGAFLGCCVIAAVIWYVGRKIARALYAIGLVLETHGQRTVENWPSDEEVRRVFHE